MCVGEFFYICGRYEDKFFPKPQKQKIAMQKTKKSPKQERKVIADFMEMLFLRAFQEQASIISKVCRVKNTTQSARYFIALKKDTHKNRNAVFSILNWYDSRLALEYPIYFEFVTLDIMERLQDVETVVDNEPSK